jgi:lantibiotic modifying enzyme
MNSGACLCHGHLSNLELLLTGHALHLDGATDTSLEQYLDAIVSHLENHGIVSGLQGEGAITYLRTRLAGVAYQLMRALHADKVPNILLLQS